MEHWRWLENRFFNDTDAICSEEEEDPTESDGEFVDD